MAVIHFRSSYCISVLLTWNPLVGSRVCGNPHGIIRKYGLLCCRRCFSSNAKEIGFIKVKMTVTFVVASFIMQGSRFELSLDYLSLQPLLSLQRKTEWNRKGFHSKLILLSVALP